MKRFTNILVLSIIALVANISLAASPTRTLLPSDNIQDPGNINVGLGLGTTSCLPAETNCYIDFGLGSITNSLTFSTSTGALTSVINGFSSTTIISEFANLAIGNATLTNSTSTNSYVSGLLTSISSFVTNLFATNATITNASTTGAFVNTGTTTLATTTVSNLTAETFNVSNISAPNGIYGNFTATNTLAVTGTSTFATVTSATTTSSFLNVLVSLFANVLNAVTANITNLFATNATTTNATTTGTLVSTGTTTLATTTATTLSSNNLTTGDITSTGTTTIATTTIASSTIGTANIANLNAQSISVPNLTATNATITNSTTTGELAVVGTSTFATVTSATTTSSFLNVLVSLFANVLNAVTANITNLFATNATTTNSTSTGALVSTGTTTLATTTATEFASNNITTGNISSNGTSSFATTTSASSSIETANINNLNAQSISVPNLTATNATITNSSSTYIYVSTQTTGTSTVTGDLAVNGTSTFATTTSASSSITFLNVLSNLFVNVLTAITGSFTNLFATNATTTNATTTNAFAVTGTTTLATTTATTLTSNNLTTGNISSNGTSSFATTTVSSTTIGTANISNLNIDTISAPNISANNATFTNSTTTGTLAITGTSTLATTTIATATIANVNSTSIFASILNAISAIFTNSTTTNATTTNQYAALAKSATSTTGALGVNATTNQYGGNLVNGITLGYNTVNGTNITNVLYISSATSSANVATSSNSLYAVDGNLFFNGSQLGVAGAGTEWTNFANGSGVKLSTSTAQVVIGANSTSTNSKLEVVGETTLAGTTTISGGPLSLSGAKITNIAGPTSNFDAANKAYVDSLVQGLAWQDPTIKFATTTIVSSSTGDRYVVATSTNIGLSPCTINTICENIGDGQWSTTTSPVATGTTVYINQLATSYTFNGTTWVSLGSSIQHNSLIGIQGGTTNEYYHLTQAQWDYLSTTTAQLSNLRTVGTTTFGSSTITNGLNVLGTLWANIFNTTNLVATNATITNSTTTGFAVFNGTTTFSTTTIATGTITNLNARTLAVNGTSSFATTTTASSSVSFLNVLTNLFAQAFSAVSASFTNLIATNATTTNSTSTGALVSTGTTTLATTTATVATITNLSGTNANITNSTSSNSFATTTAAVNSTVTNAFTVTGTTTLATTTQASSSITNLNATALAVNGTSSFATTTTASSSVSFLNVLTNLFAQAFSAVSASFTNLIATNATTTNATSTDMYVSSVLKVGTTTEISPLTITSNTATNTLYISSTQSGSYSPVIAAQYKQANGLIVSNTLTGGEGAYTNFVTTGNVGGNYSGGFTFNGILSPSTNSSTTEFLKISGNSGMFGNVGIGSSTPSDRLSVNGNISGGGITATRTLTVLGTSTLATTTQASSSITYLNVLTNLFASAINAINAIFTNSTTTNATTTGTLVATGSTTLATTTATEFTATNATATRLVVQATSTLATTTATNIQVLGNSTSTFASGVQAADGYFTDMLEAMNARIASLTATVASLTNLTVTGTTTFGQANSTGVAIGTTTNTTDKLLNIAGRTATYVNASSSATSNDNASSNYTFLTTASSTLFSAGTEVIRFHIYSSPSAPMTIENMAVAFASTTSFRAASGTPTTVTFSGTTTVTIPANSYAVTDWIPLNMDIARDLVIMYKTPISPTSGIRTAAGSATLTSLYKSGVNEVYSETARTGYTVSGLVYGVFRIETAHKDNLVTVQDTGGITLASSTPASTSNTLYNQAGQLFWNGSQVGSGAGALTLNNNGTITNASSTAVLVLASQTSPATTSNALYNNSGVLYWNGTDISTSASQPFTYAENITAGDLIKINPAGTVSKIVSTLAGGSTTVSTVGTSNYADTGTITQEAITAITGNVYVSVFNDGSSLNYQARVGNITGTTTIWGGKFDTGIVISTSPVLEDLKPFGSDRFIIAAGSSPGTKRMVIGQVSGFGITFGSVRDVSGDVGTSFYGLKVSQANASKIMILIGNNGGFGGTNLATYSLTGTALAYDSNNTQIAASSDSCNCNINSTNGSWSDIVSTDVDRMVIAYDTAASGATIRHRAVSLSGTTITFGSAVDVSGSNVGGSRHVKLAKANTGVLIAVYSGAQGGTAQSTFVQKMTQSGTTLTNNGGINLDSDTSNAKYGAGVACSQTGVCAIASQRALASNGLNIYIISATTSAASLLSSLNIVPTNPNTDNNYTSLKIAGNLAANNGQYVLAYNENAVSDDLNARFIGMGSATVVDAQGYAGVALTTAAAASQGQVAINSKNANTYSGLVAGSIYYINPSTGALTSSASLGSYVAGRAISSTALQVLTDNTTLNTSSGSAAAQKLIADGADNTTYITTNYDGFDENAIRFFTTGLQRLIIDAAGRFGFGGASSPTSLVQVSATSSALTSQSLFRVTDSSAATTSLTANALGQVAIGTSTFDSWARLLVGGTLRLASSTVNGVSQGAALVIDSGTSSVATTTNALYNLGGALYFNGFLVGTSTSFAASYMHVVRGVTNQNANLAINDHADFDTVLSQFGNDITLDIASAYSATNNIASRGRITLKAGKTYKLTSALSPYSTGADYESYAWYNADTGVQLGNSGRIMDATVTNGSLTSQPIALAYFTPTSDTRVEVRFQSAVGTLYITNGGGQYQNWATIEVVAGASAVTGQSVDTLQLGLNDTTYDVTTGAGTDYIFPKIVSGNIPYSTTTGRITLTAGKTYLLKGSLQGLAATSPSGSTRSLVYQWVDATTNTALITNQGVGNAVILNDGADSWASQSANTAEIIYTPQVDQTVKLRIINKTGTFTFRQNNAQGYGGSYATVQQLGSTATTEFTDNILSNFTASTTIMAGTLSEYINHIKIAQASSSITLTIPSPSNTTLSRIVYIDNTGTANFFMHGVTVGAGESAAFKWNGTTWKSFGNQAANVAAEFGEQIFVTSQQTLSTSLTDLTSSSFTLPTAGVWEVSYTAGVFSQSDSDVTTMITTAAGVEVPNSRSVYKDASASQSFGTNVATVRITTTGSEGYKLRGVLDSGSSGGVLASNAAGSANKVTWKKISGYIPVAGQSVDYASGYEGGSWTASPGIQLLGTGSIGGNINSLAGTAQRVDLSTPLQSTASGITIGSNFLTVSKTGSYRIAFSASVPTPSTTDGPGVQIVKNGTTVLSANVQRTGYSGPSADQNPNAVSVNTIVNLNAGDTIDFRIAPVNTGTQFYITSYSFDINQLGTAAFTSDSILSTGGNMFAGFGNAISVGSLNNNSIQFIASSTVVGGFTRNTGSTASSTFYVGTTTPNQSLLADIALYVEAAIAKLAKRTVNGTDIGAALVIDSATSSVATTTNALYSLNGKLYYNGAEIYYGATTSPTQALASYARAYVNGTNFEVSTAVDSYTDSRVLFDTIDSQFGNDISIDTSTGIFTLKAGKTYRIRSSPNPLYTPVSEYDVTLVRLNNTATGQVIASTTAGAATGNTDGLRDAFVESIVTPTTDSKYAINLESTWGVGYTVFNSKRHYLDIEVIAGASAVTGSSIDYMIASGTPLTATGDITSYTVQSSNGLSNPTSGIFTLTPGKTYKLKADANLSSGGSGNYRIEWVDLLNNPLSTNSSNNGQVGGIGGTSQIWANANAVFTPTATTTVKLRVVTATNITTTFYGTVAVDITQLGTTATTEYTNNVLSNFSSNATTSAGTLSEYVNHIQINQTTAGVTLNLPNPSNTSLSRIVYIDNVGTVSFYMHGVNIGAGESTAYKWNGTTWKSFGNQAGNVASEFGNVILNNQVFNTNSYVDSTNGVYNLTSAGTWLLTYDIMTDGTGANSNPHIAITNSSDVVVDGSEKTRGGSVTTAQALTGSVVVTTNGPATYKLRGRNGGSGSMTILNSVTSGDSTISWQKISGFLGVTGQTVDWSDVELTPTAVTTNLYTVPQVNSSNLTTLVPTTGKLQLTGSTVTGNLAVDTTTNHTITISKSGTYDITGIAQISNTSTNNNTYMQIVKNGSSILAAKGGRSDTGAATMQVSAIWLGNLNAGDTIDFRIGNNSTGVTGISGHSIKIKQLGSSAFTSNDIWNVGGNSFTNGLATTTLGNVNNAALSFITNNIAKFTLGTSTNNFARLNGYGAGTLTTDASGNITASSDGVLKQVTGSFNKGLEAILGLMPATYTWTDSSGLDQSQTYSGFIAQNVLEYIPEAVGQAANGTLTLSDRPILATLVNATKELNSKIEANSLQIGLIASTTGIATESLNSITSSYYEGLASSTENRFTNLKTDWDKLRADYELLKGLNTEVVSNIASTSDSILTVSANLTLFDIFKASTTEEIFAIKDNASTTKAELLKLEEASLNISSTTENLGNMLASTTALLLELASTTASTTREIINTDGSTTTEKTYIGMVFDKISTWLGDKSNGIVNIFADLLTAKAVETEKLCLTSTDSKTCITKTELDKLLEDIGTANSIIPTLNNTESTNSITEEIINQATTTENTTTETVTETVNTSNSEPAPEPIPESAPEPAPEPTPAPEITTVTE